MSKTCFGYVIFMLFSFKQNQVRNTKCLLTQTDLLYFLTMFLCGLKVCCGLKIGDCLLVILPLPCATFFAQNTLIKKVIHHFGLVDKLQGKAE